MTVRQETVLGWIILGGKGETEYFVSHRSGTSEIKDFLKRGIKIKILVGLKPGSAKDLILLTLGLKDRREKVGYGICYGPIIRRTSEGPSILKGYIF